MARARWPLQFDCPVIHVYLTLVLGGNKVLRTPLADTGAGNAKVPFELLLEENDCLLCTGKPTKVVSLTGAFQGSYPLYLVRIQIPLLSFDDDVAVLGVPTPLTGVDGIACFRFLNRFTYGNFANAGELRLEI